MCGNVSAGPCVVDFVNVRLLFDCAVVVSDLSGNIPPQGEFQLAGMAGGRNRALDVKAVEGRASGQRAFCEPIMMRMFVVIGLAIPWSSPILRTAVLRSTHAY